MALSDDQRAMLRLLAQREQGYEEMAALMGVSVEELRERVKAALAELEREGEQAPPLPDAPAAGPVPEKEPPAAAPVAAPEPEKGPPAEKRPDQPGTTPTASPEAPARAGEPATLAPPPPPAPSKRKGRIPVPSSDGAKIGIAAVAAALVIVVVLLLTLGGGGGDGDDSTNPSAANAAATGSGGEPVSGNLVDEALEATAAGKGEAETTQAILSPSDGGEASGVAIFGRVKDKLALQVVAEGLEPLGKGETYAIWIAASPRKMLPLAASPASKEGVIASRFEVPVEVLAYLANGTFDEIAITSATVAKLNSSLQEATKSKRAPAYTGSDVMRGKITGPIIGAAKQIEEEKANGK